jgi:hypothetical protein
MRRAHRFTGIDPLKASGDATSGSFQFSESTALDAGFAFAGEARHIAQRRRDAAY